MGGEKMTRRYSSVPVPGSPLRGRGKALEGVALSAAHGITTAWAGKSLFVAESLICVWDHPRMGGEKARRRAGAFPLLGSPPHGRGKVEEQMKVANHRRITPAWAGKSRPIVRAGVFTGDHPRMGGEKGEYDTDSDNDTGSPPHGRGKGVVNGRAGLLVGITPAWAGKRPSHCSERRRSQDHPRVGGEKYDCTGQEFTNWGSPPRRRGKGGKSFTGNMFTGITPAWAGKSLHSKA